MIRDILVPLDGSRFAETALPLAAHLAQRAGARLRLVFVHEPPPVLVGPDDVPAPSLELDVDVRKREQTYLADTAVRWRGPSGGPVESRMRDGRAGPEICEEASRLPATVVVMSTHGRGAFRRFWFGSVADFVVRHFTAPVLLLPPGDGLEPEREYPLRHFLVALDLSKEAEAILEPVAALAELTKAELTLIYVVETFFEFGDSGMPGAALEQASPPPAVRAHAERLLERLAGPLRARGLRVATRVIPGINAAGALLEVLDDEAFDLIAMTTHGAGGIRRFLLGSVADKVIRISTKPVLVLRPPGGSEGLSGGTPRGLSQEKPG